MKSLTSISSNELNSVTGGGALACAGKVVRNAAIGELGGIAAGALTGVVTGYGVPGAGIGAVLGGISAGPIAAFAGVSAALGSSSCVGK
jgi:hypothetical protein